MTTSVAFFACVRSIPIVPFTSFSTFADAVLSFLGSLQSPSPFVILSHVSVSVGGLGPSALGPCAGSRTPMGLARNFHGRGLSSLVAEVLVADAAGLVTVEDTGPVASCA